jgi:hypothetical protein
MFKVASFTLTIILYVLCKCILIPEKIIAVYKGFYIPGGTQVFGKFKSLGDCKKACEITPTCFAADYNPGLKKCYVHSNLTACDNMRTHPSLVHIKKVPCGRLFFHLIYY